MVTKIDHKKDEKAFYQPSTKKISVIELPPMNFLLFDGQGNPNTAELFQVGVEALYSASYTLKFMSKIEIQMDYVVLPLEGLWWADDMDAFDAANPNKDAWKWTVMIRQPDHLTGEHVEEAIRRSKEKKGLDALDALRFETFEEGLCAQIMYIGPYADEGPTIEGLHEFIHEQGYVRSGKHHEIYLSDLRRTAPEKLKTIIRQPMAKG